MATPGSVKIKIQDLIDSANATTAKDDDNLTDCVNSLIEGYGQGGIPEILTEAEMTALLETAEVGSVYKYVGESTDTYENGGLYIVEAVS